MQEFIQKLKTKKGLLITVFLLMVFLLSVIIWYSPIIFKGYSTQGISQNLLLARNYYKTGVLATHNNQSVLISSSLVKKEGYPLVLSEYLGSFLYAQIFKITGIPNYNNLILISIILYALSLVLFTVLVLYLFNFRVAIVFSLIYMFLPVSWGVANSMGKYEFCLIFWALFFIFYFLGVKKTKQSQNKLNNLFFVVSGVFLALSALSTEAALVFALAFFVFLAVKKLKLQLIYVFVPFIVLLVIFWLPSFLSGENQYVSLFTNRTTEHSTALAQLHVFPDPYTYYFEKEGFLQDLKNQKLGWSEDLETRKILANYGLGQIGLFSRIKVSFYILFQHVSRFFSLEDFGGPLILLLWILGMVYLKRENIFIFKLFVYWITISIFVFCFVVLVSRNHLMDFIWPIVFGITLGLLYLLRIIKDQFQVKNKKALVLGVFVIGLVLYHLLLVNHVILGKQYDGDLVPRSIAYANEIKKFEIKDTDVIAMPGGFETNLNYLTDKSFVIFRSSTLDKLLNEGKIKQALEAFGVKYILGYPDELSNRIVGGTDVINIASSSLEIDMSQVSANKSFFMNLVR